MKLETQLSRPRVFGALADIVPTCFSRMISSSDKILLIDT